MFVDNLTVTVNDDDEDFKSGGFTSLREYGADVLNKKIAEVAPMCLGFRPMNVIESWSVDEIRPVMCNSGTWYKRRSLSMCLWYDKDAVG